MKKLFVIIILLFGLSFAYGDTTEEMIVVELLDGSYETRLVSDYTSDEIGLRTMSVMSTMDQAIQIAIAESNVVRAAAVSPIYLEAGSLNSTDDSWRFDVVKITSMLSEVESDIANSNVRVAIIDSGINSNLFDDINFVDGVNYTDSDTTRFSDGYGHGSHVAGIIGSKLSNSDIDGIAPGVEIVPLKVFNDNGGGNTLYLINALTYAVSDVADIDVINMSLSYTSNNSIINNLLVTAESKGIVVVAATGNYSDIWTGGEYNYYTNSVSEIDPVRYPAALDTVLAIGSVRKHSTENKVGISDFSSAGGMRDGSTVEVDLVAPGSNIVSWNENTATTEYNSGTSMASPHVAALAALIQSKYPSLSAVQIRNLIKETATLDILEDPTSDLDAGTPVYASPTYVGQGLMNVQGAYKLQLFNTIDLKKIDNSTLGFVFDPNLSKQTLIIPRSEDSVNMTGAFVQDTVMSLNGNPITSLTQTIDTSSESTTVTLLATYNGYSSTYEINIIKDKPTLDSATLTGSAALDVTKYTDRILVDKTLNSVTLALVAADSVIEIDGSVVASKVFDLTSTTLDTTITVTKDSITSTYLLHLSNDSDGVLLSDLTIDGVTITDFDTEVVSYDLGTLTYDESYDLLATATDGTATVEYSINGADYDASASFTAIPEVTNNIKIRVSKDGYEKIYEVNYKRDDSLDFTAFNVIPVIDTVDQAAQVYTTTYNYEQTLSADTTQIKFMPTLEVGDATVSYAKDDGVFSATNTLDLEIGLNILKVKVENGTSGHADFMSRTHVYRITREKHAGFTDIALTADSLTETIDLFTAYAYDFSTLSYDLEVSDSLDTLTVSTSKNFPTSVTLIKVDDNAESTVVGDEVIRLSPGNHIILLTNTYGSVGDSDYSTKTYTYNVEVVDGTLLSDIYIKTDSINELTFDPNVVTHNVEVVAGSTEFKFKATRDNTDYGDMKIVIGGVESAYVSGTEQTIPLSAPETIKLIVESLIVSENKTHTFNITERAASTVKTLSTLTVSGYSISPVFDAATESYTLSVANGVTSVTVSAAKTSSYSTLKINGDITTSQSIALSEGSNTVTVLVTAEDNSTKSYTIIITRAAAPVVDSGSSGGSSTPPPSPPPAPPVIIPVDVVDKVETKTSDDGTEKSFVTVSKDRVLADIDDDDVKNIEVILETEDSAEVAITNDILKTVIESKKPLDIKYKDVTFKMTSEVIEGLNIKGDLNVVFESVTTGFSSNKVISEVYELDILDGVKKASFDVPIPVILIYDSKKIKDPSKLAIYYYDEKTETWIYVGGKLLANNEIRFEAKHFTKYAIRENDKTFDDIQNHWAQDAIETLASREITSGVSFSEFAPDKTLTNAEFVVLLTKVLSLADYDGPVSYYQVNETDWFEPFFRKAHGAGLLINTFGIRMDPNAPIKREEMASLLMDAYFYYSRTNKGDQLENAVEFAADEGQVSSHFLDDVRLSYQLQLIVGDDQNMFNPQKGATRAEAAIVIKKLLVLLDLL